MSDKAPQFRRNFLKKTLASPSGNKEQKPVKQRPKGVALPEVAIVPDRTEEAVDGKKGLENSAKATTMTENLAQRTNDIVTEINGKSIFETLGMHRRSGKDENDDAKPLFLDAVAEKMQLWDFVKGGFTEIKKIKEFHSADMDDLTNRLMCE